MNFVLRVLKHSWSSGTDKLDQPAWHFIQFILLSSVFLQGVTEVLKPGESATEIKRVLLHPDTSRRMVEPDFNVKRPDGCNDSLILYVTTEQTDYEPLTQGPIDLSPHLSTRTLDSTDVCINKQFPWKGISGDILQCAIRLYLEEI